jgi:two-component system sensor histidine kinase VicK
MSALPETLLVQVFERSAACMLVKADPPNFTIAMASDAYLQLTGLKRDDLVGKHAFTVFPDRDDDPSGAITTKQAILQTIATKNKVEIPEYSYSIVHPVTRVMEEFWWASTFVPIFGEQGEVEYVLGTAIDLTEKVKSRQLLETSKREQRLLNEQLSASRRQMAAVNEELAGSESGYRNQRNRLESFISQAPAGICVLSGPNLVFEFINPLYQQLFPGRLLLGKPLLQAVPEVEGTPIWDILQDVYLSRQTFEGRELLIPLARTDTGPVEDRYFDFIYQARINEGNTVDGILVFVIEVTNSVIARQEINSSRQSLQKAEQMLRFAIDAANIGTYSLDSKTRTLIASPRLKELYGFYPDEEMSYDAAIDAVTDDFRQRLTDGVEAAFQEGKDFNMDYQVRSAHDQKLRWVRNVGKVDSHTYEAEAIFSGAVIDITEQRADEQRKNDFIGMVSHELKTPLTSLSAIIQATGIKLKNNPEPFLAGAMERAKNQVKKMTKMIDGFLNVSRLESGKIVINKEQFNIDDVLEEIIKETELTTGIAIHFDACQPLTINADRDKITSVVANLLSNAVKYAPNSKIIDVKCATREDMVIVSIQDYGMGVKRQDRDKLFDRYYRVENNTTQNISGFGIGLYLSAEIIYRHGGKIWLESEYGFGSTFYFSLPLNSV